MPQPKRTATGVLGGIAGLVGLSAIAGVLVAATVTPAIAVSGLEIRIRGDHGSYPVVADMALSVADWGLPGPPACNGEGGVQHWGARRRAQPGGAHAAAAAAHPAMSSKRLVASPGRL